MRAFEEQSLDGDLPIYNMIDISPKIIEKWEISHILIYFKSLSELNLLFKPWWEELEKGWVGGGWELR